MVRKTAHSWGFHPRHLAPPWVNPGEGINRTITLRRGSPGDRAVLSFNACVLFI